MCCVTCAVSPPTPTGNMLCVIIIPLKTGRVRVAEAASPCHPSWDHGAFDTGLSQPWPAKWGLTKGLGWP